MRHEAQPVACAAAVMEEIRAYVMAGFRDLPRGGLEVGGVLLGRVSGDAAEIRAWRPMECEHAQGPRFVLSSKDEAALGQTLHAPEANEGLEVIGWFRSTRSADPALSAEDGAFHERHFPYPSQLALVLRPANLEPVRARYFRRDTAAGGWAAIGDEFTVRTLARVEAGAAKVSDPPAVAVAARVEKGRGAWWKLTTAGLGMALAVSAGATALAWFHESGPERLALSGAGREHQLLVAWDASTRAVREAERGVLEIVAGARQSVIELNRHQVRRGSHMTARENGDVEIRLTLFQGGRPALHEVARLVEPPAAPTAEPGEELAHKVGRLSDELRQEKARARRLQQTNELLWKQLRSAGVE